VTFTEIGAGTFVLRYPVLDVSVGLVVGARAALLIDTLSNDAQAAELLEQVRRITALPLHALNTHHHFDHCYGNAYLAGRGATLWAHEAAAAAMHQPQQWPGLQLGTPLPPTNLIARATTIDLGGRVADVRFLGPAHTAGDLVVFVPDADTVFAGDLVEESGPPQFDDAYPLDWPDALAALVAALGAGTTVVPGHGAPTGRTFVEAQHRSLAALDWLIREGESDGAPIDRVAARAPFDPATARTAIRRGYDHLAGKAL
jgi:glyoxylase-like metal-dependent hydrolase (beta-lactamase superfamily II)